MQYMMVAGPNDDKQDVTGVQHIKGICLISYMHMSKFAYANRCMMISKFNDTSRPKRSYSTKAGVNCPMSLNSSLEKNVMVLQSKNCTV